MNDARLPKKIRKRFIEVIALEVPVVVVVVAAKVVIVAANDPGPGAEGGGTLRSRPPEYVLHALDAGLGEEHLLQLGGSVVDLGDDGVVGLGQVDAPVPRRVLTNLGDQTS